MFLKYDEMHEAFSELLLYCLSVNVVGFLPSPLLKFVIKAAPPQIPT